MHCGVIDENLAFRHHSRLLRMTRRAACQAPSSACLTFRPQRTRGIVLQALERATDSHQWIGRAA